MGSWRNHVPTRTDYANNTNGINADEFIGGTLYTYYPRGLSQIDNASFGQGIGAIS